MGTTIVYSFSPVFFSWKMISQTIELAKPSKPQIRRDIGHFSSCGCSCRLSRRLSQNLHFQVNPPTARWRPQLLRLQGNIFDCLEIFTPTKVNFSSTGRRKTLEMFCQNERRPITLRTIYARHYFTCYSKRRLFQVKVWVAFYEGQAPSFWLPAAYVELKKGHYN